MRQPGWKGATTVGTLAIFGAVGGACAAQAPLAPPTPDAGAAEASTDLEASAPSCIAPSVLCGQACVSGVSDCSFAVTSLAPISTSSPGGAADWVCGGAFFRVSGHGFVKGTRLFLGDGRAPIRVIDDQHAIIQAPPGLEGEVDVTITSGTLTATSHAAFTYEKEHVDDTTPWTEVTATSLHSDLPSISVLQDGRALVAGGYPYDGGDLFNLGEAQTVATAPMHTVRWNHTSVTLLDGRVAELGASGFSEADKFFADSTITDLFDPTSASFSTAAGMPAEYLVAPRAVLLVDGRVLILSYQTKKAEIFDPDTQQFTTIEGAPTIDYYQVVGNRYLTRLRDGRVLIVTGQGRDAYLFDSDADTFSVAGKGPAAGPDGLITLPDGRALAVGGSVVTGSTAPNWWGGTSSASDVIEVFDPSNSSAGFSPASYVLTQPREVSAVTLGRDGNVLVMGGATGSLPIPYGCGKPAENESPTGGVDSIDPVAGTVKPFSALPVALDFLAAATMSDGSAVVAGGGICGGDGGAVGSPQIYFRKAVALPN